MMGKTSELSQDLRNLIVAKHTDGIGYRRISKILKVPVSTVGAIIRKWKEHHFTANRPRSGAPRKILDRGVKRIVQRVVQEPRNTCEELQKDVESTDDSKVLIGSTGTLHCRKTVPNTTHFRTIAPKVAPKIVPSCSSSSYPPSISEVAMPGAKPLVTNTQNYTLMKVAGHDGTFSLVALPQVTSPMGGSMIQTAGIPLQENLKLPIPRYQPARSKKFLNKKTKGSCTPKPEKPDVPVNKDGPLEAAAKLVLKTEKAEPLVVEESGRMFLGSDAEVSEGNNSTIPGMDKCINPTFCTGNSVTPRTDIEKAVGSPESAPLVRYESTKVVDSTNSLTVLSPVVFSSPLHLLQSVPKGKLPILPYSKIKKSITLETNATKPSVGQPGVQTEPCQVQFPSSPSVSVLKVSTLDSPCQPAVTSSSSILTKQNCGVGRKRGKKRKPCSEMAGYQAKMRLVGSKLITCKEKCKAEVDVSSKSQASLKKYRSIMPKPMLEIQSLVSPNASNTLLTANMVESHLRNRLFGGRIHRWRQGDHSLLTQRSTAKVCYKCHICEHSFQFKHHLQDHLNSHSNKRPYHCRLCRKAYVHSGSLSTHMKLHHSESRLKKLMCCEFCAKVFGHIRVYFGHLKEVHRVIISTESSCKTPEKKNLSFKVKSEDNLLLNRQKNLSNEDDSMSGPTDQIRLQIKCGRCPFIAPTFSDMKLHLFNVHGDESQEVLAEGVLESKEGAQEEMVKQATHHWRLLNERRHGVRGCNVGPADTCRSQEPCTSDTTTSESTPPVEGIDDQCRSMNLSSEVNFYCKDYYNCLLCAQMLKTKKDLFEHWEKKHNCENPSLLWTIFSSLPKNDHKVT